jgi:hypothetical protein
LLSKLAIVLSKFSLPIIRSTCSATTFKSKNRFYFVFYHNHQYKICLR